VPGLGLRHSSQDVGLTLVQSPRDQFVNGARQDLAAPRGQQPLADGASAWVLWSAVAMTWILRRLAWGPDGVIARDRVPHGVV